MSDEGLERVAALRLARDAREPREELLVRESPVAFVVNGEEYAVMFATPVDLEDFALGFALAEGLVRSASELRVVDRVPQAMGVTLELLVPPERLAALADRRRAAAAGCGLCGLGRLGDALRAPPPVSDAAPIAPTAIREALAAMAAQQPLNAASGGVHAAGIAHADGLLVREDVGRHNALDKAIGAAVRAALRMRFALVTSRASWELVHKAASAGLPLLAAISAPSADAVRLAEVAGLTLVAFARGSTMTVYTHPARLRD